MSNGSHYQKLKGLVDGERLSMHLIIAPPRTNSSLVVTDVVTQQDEHVREWKRHHSEMRLR